MDLKLGVPYPIFRQTHTTYGWSFNYVFILGEMWRQLAARPSWYEKELDPKKDDAEND